MSHRLYIFLFGLAVVAARHVNFYRKDYTYFEEYDAFYKLHNDFNGSSWNSSFLACDDEDADLFYPTKDNEWEVATKLLQAAPASIGEIENRIFVGIHDQFFLGEYVTLNGHPVNISIDNLDNSSPKQHCITMYIETGAYRAEDCSIKPAYRPFICKKVEDISCPTIDKGYMYAKETRKCYKVNYNPKTWSKAMATCFMEGGSLVVIGSKMESKIISDLLKSHKYHAGFKKMFPVNEFYTVKGHKLHDSGFNDWYDSDRQSNYDCGAIFKNDRADRIYLYANKCDDKLYFVCEMDVIV